MGYSGRAAAGRTPSGQPPARREALLDGRRIFHVQAGGNGLDGAAAPEADFSFTLKNRQKSFITQHSLYGLARLYLIEPLALDGHSGAG